MTRLRASSHSAGERGFVLVGVVMFVLALTILGLSLFSLSSYEAQFLGVSIRGTQAHYSALSGIERAKNLFAVLDSIETVKSLEGQGSIVYAHASFVNGGSGHAAGDSTGELVWDGSQPVLLRMLADENGARTMVEMQITPYKPPGIYENLITSAGGVAVREFNAALGNYPAAQQTYFNGSVWQGSSNLDWFPITQTTTGHPVSVSSAPLPADASYIATWSSSATPPTLIQGPNHKTFLLAPPDSFQHFIGPSDPGGPPPPPPYEAGFGYFNSHPGPEIYVTGTAVWMLPGGAQWEQQVVVHDNDVGSRLIIVATPSMNDQWAASDGFPNVGLWFRGGLVSATVPIILVSSGTVASDRINNQNASGFTSWISMFGGSVMIVGPENPRTDTFNHDVLAGSPPDDDVLEDLINWGVLPNVSAGAVATFPLVPGTWREYTN